MIRRMVENPRWRTLAVTATIALLCLAASVSHAETCVDYEGHLKWVGNCSLPNTGAPWNGECVTVQGDFAYVGEDGSMCVVDITDPANPYVRGVLALSGQVMDIAVEDTVAYLAIDNFGLLSVNISDPDTPVAGGGWGSQYGGYLAVEGNHLYLVRYISARGRNGLYIFDISNPLAPNQIYFDYTSGFTVHNLKKQGDYLYFGSKGEFIILSVANPAAPYTALRQSVPGATSFQTGLGVHKDALDNTFVFVNMWGDLLAYDVTNLASPLCVDTLQVLGLEAGELETNGGIAVISNAEGLIVVDVADPENMSRLGSVEVVGAAENNGVALAGDKLLGYHAYVTSANTGFHVVDLPASPLARRYSPPSFGRLPTTNARDVVVVDDLAFIADPGDGLVIADVADSTAPFVVGSYPLSSALGVDVDGDYAYVVTGGAGQGYLKVFDISPPDSVWEIASHQFVGHEAHDVVVQDGYAYIVGGWRCFVVDISIPAAPNVVKTLTTSMTYPKNVALGPGYALYGFQEGFVIVDITDPPNAFVTGTWYAPPGLGGIGAVDTDGTDAFVSHPYGFTAVSITPPSAPDTLSTFYLPETEGIFYSEVVVVGDVAFVAMATAGIYVMDITDPTNMEFIGTSDPLGPYSASASHSGQAGGLFVTEDFSYIADGESGLQIVASHCCDWPVTGVVSGRERPVNPALLGAAPNPFAQSTTIWFAPEAEGPLRIEVFDVTGRLVDVLVDDVVPAGLQSVTWRGVDSRGRAVPSGTYFYRLTADGRTATKKLLLLK